MTRHAAYLVTIAAITLNGAGGIPTACAEDASAWDGELHAAARLIAGKAVSSGDARWLQAGIEVRLDPGWKTYWRYPGDSGVPPTIDFAGSENIKSATLLWPAPQRFGDGAGGQSIGYLNDVVLPLRIVPENPATPVTLHVKLGYAICGNLCIPAEAALALTLSGSSSGAEEKALKAAEARVPRRVALGAEPQGGGLAIRSVHRESGGARERVVVEVAAPSGVPIDLFAEGPTADWALPLPEPSAAPPGNGAATRRFTFELDGLPPNAKADGAILTFTAISPVDAIEVQTHLD
jgi:DsbC/DsbD-like thiol-disulfide interchange protein